MAILSRSVDRIDGDVSVEDRNGITQSFLDDSNFRRMSGSMDYGKHITFNVRFDLLVTFF